MRVVSRWCRCVVQRLCATDCKHPCLVRAAAPNSAPARTPGVYAQGFARCKASQAYTAFHRGRGFRQGCRNKDTPSFKHGCLQVVEQSRCRTHRQQTTTVAQKQSPQSVLKGIGIENKHFFEKTDFFYKLMGLTACGLLS